MARQFTVYNNIKNLITLGDKSFFFNVTWNYKDFAFLQITDLDDNTIYSSALVNNLRIRHKDIPYVLYFVNLRDMSYEPTKKNLSIDFAFVYEDSEE